MSDFKIAIAGLGWWGKVIIDRLSMSKTIDISYIIDPNPDEDAIKLAFDAEMSGGGRTSMYHPCTEAMDSVKRRRSNGVIFRNYIGGKVRSGKKG